MGRRAAGAAVLAVVVLAGGAVVVDGVARGRTETDLGTSMQEQIPGLTEPADVTIGGFPFLTQVAAGELSDLRVTADQATVQGLDLRDVVVQLRGVTTSRPTVAREAVMTARVSVESMAATLPDGVELRADGAALVATVTVLGLPIDLALAPRADGDAIAVDLEGISVGGLELAVEDLPAGVAEQVQGLRVPIIGLPDGLELTDARMAADGLEIEATGTDVVLEPPPG